MLSLEIANIRFIQRPPIVEVKVGFAAVDGKPLLVAECPTFQVLADVKVTSTAPGDTGKGKYIGFTQIMTKSITKANYTGREFSGGQVDLDWSRGPTPLEIPCRDVLRTSSVFVNYPGADDISFPAYKSSTELTVPKYTTSGRYTPEDFGFSSSEIVEKWPRTFTVSHSDKPFQAFDAFIINNRTREKNFLTSVTMDWRFLTVLLYTGDSPEPRQLAHFWWTFKVNVIVKTHGEGAWITLSYVDNSIYYSPITHGPVPGGQYSELINVPYAKTCTRMLETGYDNPARTEYGRLNAH